MKVYLCGGFKSGWQDKVIEEVRRLRADAEIGDPRENYMLGFRIPADYTPRNLLAITGSDLIFAYMEKDNPGYPNFAFEIGFAHCMGKKIILVNEKGPRWAEMLHHVADVYGDIESALAALPHIKEFRA